MTALLAQYLGAGTLVNRPETPDIAEGFTAFYFAEDEGTLYFWQPPVDPDPGAWLSANPVLPPPVEEGVYGWDAATQTWVVIPPAPEPPDVSGFITDAPEDGNEYVRKDAEWVESSGGGEASYPDFAGNAGKFLAVTDDESGVEWSVPAGGSGGGGVVPVETELTPFPAYQNGYSNYGSGYQGAKAIKIGRIVVVTGLMKGPSDQVAFTMPAGWCPVENLHGMSHNNGAAAWDFFPDGTYKTIGNTDTYASLDLIYEVPESDGSYAEVGGDSGGGGGGGSFVPMRDQLRRAAAEWMQTNGQLGIDQSVDFKIIDGDWVGLHHHRYARGNTWVDGVNARFTVPEGRVAYVVEGFPSQNVRQDHNYYKVRLYNETTAQTIIEGNSALIGFAGNIEQDYNTTVANNYDTMCKAGVAGDVLNSSAAGGGDSICRSVVCDWVLILLDA